MVCTDKLIVVVSSFLDMSSWQCYWFRSVPAGTAGKYYTSKQNGMRCPLVPPQDEFRTIPVHFDHSDPFWQNRLVFKLRPIWKLFCTQTQYTQTLILLLLSLFFLLRLSLASVTFLCCFLVSRKRERLFGQSRMRSLFPLLNQCTVCLSLVFSYAFPRVKHVVGFFFSL